MDLKTTIVGGCIGIAVVTLVGCGGGGEGDPIPTPDSSVNNVTLDGTAAKGIIRDGIVVAEELDISGTVVAQIGAAITAADGSYTLAIDDDYTGGPIRITISADANTQMKCDVPAGCGTRTDNIADSDSSIDFSEWYRPGNLAMMALVAEAVVDDDISVNITPYTDLAARRALAVGSLTANEVFSANSEVSNLLGGIDILNTQPLDITDADAVMEGDNASRVAYAAFSAAIAALADTSGGNPDINAALATLWDSFRDGSIIADDTGTVIDNSTISLQEIIDAATGALAQMDVADTSGAFVLVQASIDAANGGSVDPQPSPITGSTALARVKAFVNDVRTWGTVIEEETRVRGDAFNMQVDLASTAADASMSLMVDPAFVSTIEAIFLRLTTTNATDLAGGDYVVGAVGSPQFESGSIVYSGGVVTIINGVIDGVTVNLSVQLPDDNSTEDSSLTVVVNSATFISASTDLTMDSGIVVASLAAPYFVDYAAIGMGVANVPDILGGSVSLDVSLVQKLDDFGTPLPSSVIFEGALSATLVNPVKDASTGIITWFTPSILTLTGSVSDTVGNSFTASFTANISNAETFTPVGDLSDGVDFVLENIDNWLMGTIGLNFMLQLGGLPEASVNISGDRSDFETGTATVVISYGARQIVIAGAFTGDSSTGSMTVTNQDGVTMSIVGDDFDVSMGNIEYNGQIYGSITELENGLTKITYIDGTFETL